MGIVKIISFEEIHNLLKASHGTLRWFKKLWMNKKLIFKNSWLSCFEEIYNPLKASHTGNKHAFLVVLLIRIWKFKIGPNNTQDFRGREHLSKVSFEFKLI